MKRAKEIQNYNRQIQYLALSPTAFCHVKKYVDNMSLPVDNFVFMKVLQAEDDAGRVEDGPGLCEDVSVDVHHEVASRRVLHHKANVTLKKLTFNLAKLKKSEIRIKKKIKMATGKEDSKEKLFENSSYSLS